MEVPDGVFLARVDQVPLFEVRAMMKTFKKWDLQAIETLSPQAG
jgi:hypothetical protein